MNRLEFLKATPFIGALLMLPSTKREPERIIEHIHINGDNAVVSHNVIRGSDKQPAIYISKPVKLYGPDGRMIRCGHSPEKQVTVTDAMR